MVNVKPGTTFKVKRRVVEQLIKLKEETEYTFLLRGEIYKAKDVARTRKESEPKDPPYLCSVTDMTTGEEGVIIVPTVLRSELEDFYPDSTYIGRVFQICKHKIEGKRYSTWDIAEMEPDEGEGEDVSAVEAKAKPKGKK